MTYVEVKHKPLKKGYYTCLIDWDGFGNLQESKNELFNGEDWDHQESSKQFIRYWKATKKDYEAVMGHIEKEGNMTTDWLDQYGDPEVAKYVEREITSFLEREQKSPN